MKVNYVASTADLIHPHKIVKADGEVVELYHTRYRSISKHNLMQIYYSHCCFSFIHDFRLPMLLIVAYSASQLILRNYLKTKLLRQNASV